jgi:putative transposase
MPAVGFRFRAHAGRQTLGGVKGPVEAGLRGLQCPAAGIDFHRRNGRGLTLTELRQLALDLRKRSEGYQQLYSQVAQEIADRFHGARRRFREGVLQARIREPRSEAGRQGLRVPGPRLEGRSRLQRVPQHIEEGRVGATRGACGAPPPAHGRGPRARWGREAGSPALQGGVAHRLRLMEPSRFHKG